MKDMHKDNADRPLTKTYNSSILSIKKNISCVMSLERSKSISIGWYKEHTPMVPMIVPKVRYDVTVNGFTISEGWQMIGNYVLLQY